MLLLFCAAFGRHQPRSREDMNQTADANGADVECAHVSLGIFVMRGRADALCAQQTEPSCWRLKFVSNEREKTDIQRRETNRSTRKSMHGYKERIVSQNGQTTLQKLYSDMDIVGASLATMRKRGKKSVCSTFCLPCLLDRDLYSAFCGSDRCHFVRTGLCIHQISASAQRPHTSTLGLDPVYPGKKERTFLNFHRKLGDTGCVVNRLVESFR